MLYLAAQVDIQLLRLPVSPFTHPFIYALNTNLLSPYYILNTVPQRRVRCGLAWRWEIRFLWDYVPYKVKSELISEG